METSQQQTYEHPVQFLYRKESAILKSRPDINAEVNSLLSDLSLPELQTLAKMSGKIEEFYYSIEVVITLS